MRARYSTLVPIVFWDSEEKSEREMEREIERKESGRERDLGAAARLVV